MVIIFQKRSTLIIKHLDTTSLVCLSNLLYKNKIATKIIIQLYIMYYLLLLKFSSYELEILNIIPTTSWNITWN